MPDPTDKPDRNSSLEAPRRGDAIAIDGGYQYRARHEGFVVQRFWHAEKTRLVDRRLTLSADDRVLDCGAGSGVVAEYAASFGCREVVGVDGNAEAVDFASATFQRPNLRFEKAFFEEMPFEPGRFTKILCLEVIEHLYARQGLDLLERFLDLLAPGGVVLLTTPNYHGLWPPIEWLMDRLGSAPHMEDDQHVSRYHRRSLRRALETAGFNRVEVGTFCTFAPFLSPLGWRLAEAVSNFEHAARLPFGSLIWAVAHKPGDGGAER